MEEKVNEVMEAGAVFRTEIKKRNTRGEYEGKKAEEEEEGSEGYKKTKAQRWEELNKKQEEGGSKGQT